MSLKVVTRCHLISRVH